MNSSSTPSALRRARLAVSLIFFVNGAGFATWVPHIPWIQQRFSLSESGLGLTLLIIACGAIIAMPITGGLVERLGSKRVAGIVSIGFCFLLASLPLMPSYAGLAAMLFLFGMVNGSMDVAMNAHGVFVEKKYQKPIMSSFHGLFSTGGLVGAGVASGLLALGLTPVQHMLSVITLLLITTLIAIRYLLPHEPVATEPGQKQPLFVLPSKQLVWLLAFLGFFILMVEGAMADWTAIHITELPEATPALAAMGFAAFSLTMAIGRLTGDVVIRTVGRPKVVRWGSFIAAVGLVIVVLWPYPVGAIAGFGLVGIGLSNVIPIIFSSAGYANPTEPGRGIAAVTTMGYFGFLVGPPLIGFIAEGISLTGAWALLSLFLLIVVTLAPRIISKIPNAMVTAH
uniref:MFS transporter n=1 Tax=Roseihalotalea indica TaxID=2867963 RepID=A0AA49GMC1_9BACT|nr:MFS transporter [Tunicatimonas sp. TK19036]